MTQLMDCARVEELLSDHAEGTLDPDLRAGLEAHLPACPGCRELRAAFEEVRQALADFPDAAPTPSLVDRIVASTTRGPRPVAMPPRVVIRPALPSWVQAAAAGFGLIALGGLLLVMGPEPQSRVASQLVERSVEAGTLVVEKGDRLVDDVRTFGTAFTSAVEGRLERMNERMEDYRRLLERRRGETGDDSKRGQADPREGAREVASFRTGDVLGA